jgi:hypothetical protein
MDERKAYNAGWNASKRSVTCDLEAAEDRFTRKHGRTFHDAFVCGWTDYASDNAKREF